MFPWNDRNILPPPINTFHCTHDVDSANLKYTFDSILRILTKQSPLHQESAIISRFIYRYDKKFRMDLGYRKLKKLNSCLRRYLELNLIKDIEAFKSTLPADNDYSYLPTRQMLQYVLVRIISFSMIMLKVYIVSRQAAVFYMDRIKRGESFWMSLLPYAAICRIWSISLVLLQHSSKWYQKLLPYLQSLELKGVHFLSDENILPNDLKKHLEFENKNDFGRFDWTLKKIVKVESILNDDEFDEAFDLLKYIQEINQSNESEEKIEEPSPTDSICQDVNLNILKTTDVGQIVGRDYFMSKSELILTNNTKTISEKKEERHDYLAVKTTNQLKSFIKNEEDYRNSNKSQSLTRHLSFMQWQSLKHLLTTITNLSDNKMHKKFKILWKEKCVDYL